MTRANVRLPISVAAALLGLAVGACGDRPGAATADRAAAPPAERAQPAPPAAPASASMDRLISDSGIGRARARMTIGELRRALEPELLLGAPAEFMVDIDALPVIQGTDTLYHVMIPAGEPADDSLHLTSVATLDPTVRTAEGIGPGATLARAAEVYGSPTLSFNVNDESREYASFPRYGASNVLFRVAPPTDATAFAGTYTTVGEQPVVIRADPSADAGSDATGFIADTVLGQAHCADLTWSGALVILDSVSAVVTSVTPERDGG